MSAAERALPVSVTEAAALFADLPDRAPVVLAVSGGPDSTALLFLAARWRARRKSGPALHAVTIDHGLRKESMREARAVKRLAATLGIAHRTLRWSARKPATGLQEAARQARYRLLAKEAERIGARHILTAHTLDDQAETVLFRMARGSGLAGLAGMARVAPLPVGGESAIVLVRPLLDVPKARLVATLKAARIPFAEDPSNRDPRFARARLRLLMPALAHEGLTARRLALLARRAERVEEALSRVVAQAQRSVSGRWSDAEPITIKASAFADLPREIALRILGQAIEFKGGEGRVELAKLEALQAAMSEPLSAAISGLGKFGRFRRTLAGAMVTLAGDRLTVDRAPPRRSGRKAT